MDGWYAVAMLGSLPVLGNCLSTMDGVYAEAMPGALPVLRCSNKLLPCNDALWAYDPQGRGKCSLCKEQLTADHPWL